MLLRGQCWQLIALRLKSDFILFCGLICVIGEIILDKTKLTPGHITTLFVVLGVFLDTFDIYDKIILYVGGGALVPITSFGHSLVHSALYSTNNLRELITNHYSN